MTFSGQSLDFDHVLRPFARFGVHLGLERVSALLAALDNPQQQIPLIHVAGTNGKGSVCAYLASVLTTAGYRVGRYTSPHLVSWCERIDLDECSIPAAELHRLLEHIRALTEPWSEAALPTQFEVLTAAAWLHFAQQGVDVAVMEVGLGGRLDATNVCDRPLASIITSIGWDHWQHLGPTLADIAREKAGILKPCCPAIVGPLTPEAAAVVVARATALGCPTTWVSPAVPLQPGWADYDGLAYPLPLLGAVQLTNSALAIATVQSLRRRGWPISDAAIITGLQRTRWPGRLQWTTWHQRRLLLDGAHNREAAQGLRQYIDSLDRENRPTHLGESRHADQLRPVTWIMGMLSTKDHAGIFQALLRPGDRLYLVPVPDHSSADPEQLATLASMICPRLALCRTHPDLQTGLQAALSLQTESQGSAVSVGLPVLCGSLYLVGHFLRTQQTEGAAD